MYMNNRMISSVSTDLKVIGTYLQTSHEPKVQPRNLSELSSLVKNRLSGNLASKEKKSNCREWLQNKGMHIQPLLQYISNRNKRQKDQDKVEKKQDSFGIPVLQPTLYNHEEYSQKAIQYATTNILKYVQTSRSMNKRYFKNAMLKLRCQSLQPSQSHVIPSLFSSSVRNLQKRNIYIKTVKKLLDYQINPKKQKGLLENTTLQQSEKVAKLFYQNISHKIWLILYHQVKKIDFSKRKESIMAEILINSLKLVEDEFNEDLPLNKQAINYYLQQKYLNQIDRNGQYEFHQDHGSIWGKAFLYFRAGRIKEVIDLLQNTNQRQLVKQISLNFESINHKTPKKVIINSFLTKPTQDIFREQILFAIGGQRKYSSQILADTSNLDCVWVLLRNTGIYYQTDSDLFEQMKSQMGEYYRQSNQQKQQVYKCAYLADYDSILRMSPNEILDKDDLLHFLIVMSRYPSLIKQKQFLSQRLTELTISYAIELAEEKRQELVYYILMIPQNKIVEEASTIIAGNKLYLTFSWGEIKKYMKTDLFQSLVSQSSKKFVISTRNYFQAATNLSNHIDDKETPLNLLTEMFILHYEQKKIYDQQEITKALRFYDELIKQSNQLGTTYSRLNQLFGSLRALSKASRNRNYRLIEDIVKDSQVIRGENIDYLNTKMLDKLVELNGLDVYFIFLTNISRAADYIYTVQDQQQLKQFNYVLFKTANSVINHEKYKMVAFQQSITKLVVELGEKVMESAISDYKSYY